MCSDFSCVHITSTLRAIRELRYSKIKCSPFCNHFSDCHENFYFWEWQNLVLFYFIQFFCIGLAAGLGIPKKEEVSLACAAFWKIPKSLPDSHLDEENHSLLPSTSVEGFTDLTGQQDIPQSYVFSPQHLVLSEPRMSGHFAEPLGSSACGLATP